MKASEAVVRFDWAIKKLLREKANFDVLEGFISVFTNEKVKIEAILESESNQEYDTDKFNRVDIKALNEKGEIYIIEVQLNRQVHYLERIVYGTAKAITEQMHLGGDYYDIKKVISISVVYFDLGKGSDYLYHGQTQLEGVHSHDILSVTQKEKRVMNLPDGKPYRPVKSPNDVFPEYYIIRVNEFNDYATTPIEEWMEYLKSGVIKEETKTPGLKEAHEKLRYMMMTDVQRQAYERHLDALRVENDVLGNARYEGLSEGMSEGLEKGMAEGRAKGLEEGRMLGLEEGRVEGRAEGRAEGRVEGHKEGVLTVARLMLEHKKSVEEIMMLTGLSKEELEKL